MTGFDKKTATAEEKRAKIKNLIENIPTAKDELFAFELDWKIVDQVRAECIVLNIIVAYIIHLHLHCCCFVGFFL